MENRKVMVKYGKNRLHTGWTFCLDERNEKDETAPSEGFRAVTLHMIGVQTISLIQNQIHVDLAVYAKAGIGWYQRTILTKPSNT